MKSNMHTIFHGGGGARVRKGKASINGHERQGSHMATSLHFKDGEGEKSLEENPLWLLVQI